MPEKENLTEYYENYRSFSEQTATIPKDLINACIQLCERVYQAEILDLDLGLKCSGLAKSNILRYISEQTGGGSFEWLEDYYQKRKESAEIIEQYYNALLFEAPYLLDSYCLYVERDRPRKERFYEPRRKQLKTIVDAIQELEDGKLDELGLHQPPRTGKSGIVTFATAWHICRNDEYSNLYVTYKESLGGAFLDGVLEIITDPTYRHIDVFPKTRIVSTDAKAHKFNLGRKKKYCTLSGKGLESGLNGEYDASGWLIIDDPLEGIQDALNPDTLKRKQTIFDNNVMSRKKEKCRVLKIGTIWSLHDLFSDREAFLEADPKARNIRHKTIRIPALDENDHSNFNYDCEGGFSDEYYQQLRAKFENNDDLASWYAQYQQEPIERDGAVFNPEHFKYYNGILPNETPYRICAACDVALGGEDYLSFPVAYLYEDGSVYIHDVVFDNSEKKFTKPKVVSAIINNNVGSAYFEANQGGEGYKDEVSAELAKDGIKINLRSEYAPSDKRKEQRIWDKAGSIREYYYRDTSCRSPEYRKFMTNLFSFTMTNHSKHKHEDAADSLASLAYFIEGTWSNAKVEAMINPFRRRY